jgi:hypothetical protein
MFLEMGLRRKRGEEGDMRNGFDVLGRDMVWSCSYFGEEGGRIMRSLQWSLEQRRAETYGVGIANFGKQ